MIRRAFLVTAALFSGLRLEAHKLQYSLTDLLWRPDKNVLEIEHSIHLDDAMVLLAQLGAPMGDLDIATQARVLLYAEQHFSLSTAGQLRNLEPVGVQIDGDYLWIYQELPMVSYPESPRVECSLLHDVFPAQQNQVNLRIGDSVRTLRFDHSQQDGVFSPANSG
jgi:hypothetical protein